MLVSHGVIVVKLFIGVEVASVIRDKVRQIVLLLNSACIKVHVITHLIENLKFKYTQECICTPNSVDFFFSVKAATCGLKMDDFEREKRVK